LFFVDAAASARHHAMKIRHAHGHHISPPTAIAMFIGISTPPRRDIPFTDDVRISPCRHASRLMRKSDKEASLYAIFYYFMPREIQRENARACLARCLLSPHAPPAKRKRRNR